MIETLIYYLLAIDRRFKVLLQATFDAISAFLGLFIALVLLHPYQFALAQSFLFEFLVYPVVLVGAAFNLGQYRAMTRFMGVKALRSIILSSTLAIGITWLIGNLVGVKLVGFSNQFEILVLAGTISIGFMATARLFLREIFFIFRKLDKPNIVIFGAGDAGRQLLSSMNQGSNYKVVALIDDSSNLRGSEIHGVKVFSAKELPKLVIRYRLQGGILATFAVTKERKQQILQQFEDLGLPLRTMPSIQDIMSGRKLISDLQDISVEEVLGRDPVDPIPGLMNKKIMGRSVMVSGGGGSIGSALCMKIIKLAPTKLIVLDNSEFALYQTVTALHDALSSSIQIIREQPKIIAVLQSVTNESYLVKVLKEHSVQTFFHAAAYKHVPLVESNPFSGFRNNVFGTLSCLGAAVSAEVNDFVLISTDKAVRPTNLMGATKRLSELIAQAMTARQKDLLTTDGATLAIEKSPICISMVRFGNVLSSSGSVIPRFKEQISSGGPVTVTHPEINRYFMTIPEAAELVLQASGLAVGGEVFLLEMGEPVRIVDLAKRMIRLSGYRPVVKDEQLNTAHNEQTISNGRKTGLQRDIEITFTGLRPGEKLYEELLVSANAQPTEHPKIYKAQESFIPWAELEPVLDRLKSAIALQRLDQIQEILVSLDIGYAVGAGSGVIQANSNGLLETTHNAAQFTHIASVLADKAFPVSNSLEFSGGDESLKMKTCQSSSPQPNSTEKRIHPFLSKLLHGYFVMRRPMTLGVRALVINTQNEIALVRHRYEPGWQLPGGGVEHGESPLQALRRELREEAAIEMGEPERFIGAFHNVDVSKRDHVLVYVVRSFKVLSGEQISHEIGEQGFFPLSRLPDGTTQGTRRRIAEALQEVQLAEVW